MPEIIEQCLTEHPRHKRREHCRQYYNGNHETQLTERQRKYLQIKTGQEFNDNYCPIVVDALAERMSVTGFSVSDDEAAAKTAQGLFADWWKASRMDAGQSDIHGAAVRDGDSYAMVEWNNVEMRPEIIFEEAYNGTEGVEVIYDKSRRRRPLYAFKRWKIDDDTERLNVYYPNRVEKYQRGDGSWSLLTSDAYRDAAGQAVALGTVPVFHFRNRSDGYNYGKSELHDVIPLQNALNKSIIDLVAAADTTGFRLYWMTGGDPSGIEITPGSWIYSEDPEAKIGHIQGEDLSKLIDFKDSFAMEVARVSRTPLSFFQITRQVSSEGTLKQQESGLVSRAKKRAIDFGNTWEDIFAYCRKLWNFYGDADKLDEEAQIESNWEDPEIRDDKGRLEELEIKQRLGIPQEQIWIEMGYSQDQIEKFKLMDSVQEKKRKAKFDELESGQRAGLSPEQVMREHGASDEEIAAYYRELPEQ